MTDTTTPRRDRPDIPKEYGISTKQKDMLEWSWVVEQLKAAKHYWIITTYPDGRPHAVPSWGAWVDDKLYFGGGDMTRHAKNLAKNPNMIAHLESGERVVIIYGKAVSAADTPPEVMAQIEADYTVKYGQAEGANYALMPTKVIAWQDYATTPTRFTFA